MLALRTIKHVLGKTKLESEVKIQSKLLIYIEIDDGFKPGSQELQMVPVLLSHQSRPVGKKREDHCFKKDTLMVIAAELRIFCVFVRKI